MRVCIVQKEVEGSARLLSEYPTARGGAAELERILQDPIVDGIFCCGRKWPSGVCGRILKRLWVRFGDRSITGSQDLFQFSQGSGNEQK